LRRVGCASASQSNGARSLPRRSRSASSSRQREMLHGSLAGSICRGATTTN
jgi:hypothetical protein